MRVPDIREDTPEIEEIADYWKYRSESYSELNMEEMHSWKRDAWRDLILQYAPSKGSSGEPSDRDLKILDVGTGPGFFAILLALEGYDVSAVDVTPEMIAHAKENADRYGADIHFYCHRAEQLLRVADDTFDLVVCRNVTWNLEYPKEALREWKRVLRPGGRMVYFDANWYQYLTDEGMAAAMAKDSRRLEELYPDYAAKVKKKYLFQQERMEEIAKELPLSDVKRPDWDREVLTGLGMKDIVIRPDINQLVYDEMEQVRYRSTPMFLVSACKEA